MPWRPAEEREREGEAEPGGERTERERGCGVGPAGTVGSDAEKEAKSPEDARAWGLLHFAAAFAVTAGVCTVLIPSPFCRFVGV
jgi:hypothetical protein